METLTKVENTIKADAKSLDQDITKAINEAKATVELDETVTLGFFKRIINRIKMYYYLLSLYIHTKA